MGRNKFAGVWFGLGVYYFFAGVVSDNSSAVVGVLFFIVAYLHEGLLALYQIEQNARPSTISGRSPQIAS